LYAIPLLIGKDGKPKAIQIELLAKYADLFEDFFDVAISRERLKDTSGAISLAELKKELQAEGKLYAYASSHRLTQRQKGAQKVEKTYITSYCSYL